MVDLHAEYNVLQAEFNEVQKRKDKAEDELFRNYLIDKTQNLEEIMREVIESGKSKVNLFEGKDVSSLFQSFRERYSFKKANEMPGYKELHKAAKKLNVFCGLVYDSDKVFIKNIGLDASRSYADSPDANFWDKSATQASIKKKNPLARIFGR